DLATVFPLFVHSLLKFRYDFLLWLVPGFVADAQFTLLAYRSMDRIVPRNVIDIPPVRPFRLALARRSRLDSSRFIQSRTAARGESRSSLSCERYTERYNADG